MIDSINLILTAVVYILAIVCIPIMKKIEPDNNWYPVYGMIVCILYTIFVVCYVCLYKG